MISRPTPNKIVKLIALGNDVIVSLRQGSIYHMDGSVRQNIENGHAMYVTGVTPEQKYLVSTWGEKCYIDPEDCKHSKTSMRFMYLIFDSKRG